MMKKLVFILILTLIIVSCKRTSDIDLAKTEIFQTEKEFEKMVSEKGLAVAFYFFADENAAIIRGNDSIIIGRENIKHYYEKNAAPDTRLTWTPDFIDVSDCGTLGYTYGKYKFSIHDTSGSWIENTGVFHTVWKKQNNNWRYVWD